MDDDRYLDYSIGAIHDEDGYQKIRETLSAQNNLGNLEPDIQVYSVDIKGDRTLTLHYTERDRIPLGKNTEEVLKHVYALWKYPVIPCPVRGCAAPHHGLWCRMRSPG